MLTWTVEFMLKTPSHSVLHENTLTSAPGAQRTWWHNASHSWQNPHLLGNVYGGDEKYRVRFPLVGSLVQLCFTSVHSGGNLQAFPFSINPTVWLWPFFWNQYACPDFWPVDLAISPRSTSLEWYSAASWSYGCHGHCAHYGFWRRSRQGHLQTYHFVHDDPLSPWNSRRRPVLSPLLFYLK